MTEPNAPTNTTTRRGLFRDIGRLAARAGFALLAAAGVLWTLAIGRMMMPNTDRTRGRKVIVGPIADFPLGVTTALKDQFGFYIVRFREEGKEVLVAMSAACTHLGCITNWESGPAIFKCPCHGSAFNMEGINIAGPAPRPLTRFAISKDPSGTLVVDTARRFQDQRGGWNDRASYVQVGGGEEVASG